MGDIETVRHDLKEQGRFSCELIESELEEVIPRVASEMIGKGETPPRVHVSIRNKSANLQINARIKVVSNVEANLVLENSQEQEGEIAATQIKTNPQRRMLINVQSQVEKWGRKLNAELEAFVKGALGRRDIKTTGVKFQFTQNDTLRIEIENERRLRELEARVVSPEKMEIIPPPVPPAEPKPVKEPEIITVIAEEPAYTEEVKEQTPLEKLREDVSLNRKKLEKSFEDFIAGNQIGGQFEEVLGQYTTSLSALNRFLNSQLDPESIPPGLNKTSDKYWSTNDTLESLQKDLEDEKTALRTRYLLTKRYSEILNGGGETREDEGRVELFNLLLKQGISSPTKLGRIRAEVSPQGKEVMEESDRLELFGVPPMVKHYEFVGTFNPTTGKGGYFFYFWADGQVKLQAVDEGGRRRGKEFTVKLKVDSFEEAEFSISRDLKKFETKGLQITRNIPVEVFEENRKKEFQELTQGLKEKRKSFDSARENYEDAQLNYTQAEEAYQRSITERRYPKTISGPSLRFRKGRHEGLLEIAAKEQKETTPALEDTLLAFNKYLDQNINIETLGDNKGLLERYRELGKELEKLYQEKLKIASPEQKVDLLKEYDKVFDDRLGVYIQIAKQRGQDPIPLKIEEESFINPSQPLSRAQVRKIKPTIGTMGEDWALVEASFLSSEGVPSKPNFGQLKREPHPSVEAAPSRVLEKWKAFKDKGILVTPWI